MIQTYTSTGTDAQTLHLTEPLPVTAGEVRVTVEILDAVKPKWQEMIERIEANRIEDPAKVGRRNRCHRRGDESGEG